MSKNYEYLGKNDLLYVLQLFATEFAKYVKVVDGKGLSTNDFTTELKNKLDNIDLSKYAPLSNPELTGTPKAPTATEGTNTTQIATTAFVTAAVAKAVSQITGISFQKVDNFAALPTTGTTGVIYLVPKTQSETNNVYTEYYWDTNTKAYEKLGDTSIDLSNYVTNDDIAELTTTEVKAVWDSVFTS